MPKDPEEYLAPSDFAFVEATRRRGGDRAAKKMIDAIVKRASRVMAHDERVRKAMLSDEKDWAWPPPYLTRKTPLPPMKEQRDD
jgi:hypothetical protein